MSPFFYPFSYFQGFASNNPPRIFAGVILRRVNSDPSLRFYIGRALFIKALEADIHIIQLGKDLDWPTPAAPKPQLC